jgi:hypothetical protein
VPETLQLEDVAIVELHDAPKLLVEWSPRWEEFVTSVGPAFARSGARLAGEAPHGIFPYRGLLASLLFEAFLLFVVIVVPRQIARLRPYSAPKIQPYEVIYYSGDELPRTEDLGGAQSGTSGRAGGQEAHHRTQTIHVARGGSLAQKIVDAPDLKLPSSADAVANLLAFRSTPGPPSAEGLHSSLTAPSLPVNVIAPAPTNIARDQTRTGLTFDAVIAPAPNVSSNKSRSAPALSTAVVPPAPSVGSDRALVAPSLEARIIAPAPTVSRDQVSRDRTLLAPSLNPSVIAPASTRISPDQQRSAPALNGSVIAPAPAVSGREVSPSRVQVTNVAVVPPPVSAPERDTLGHAKLNLPAPSVIAPPPSTDSTRDLRRLESGSVAPSPNVVPPPPTPSGGGSLVSNIIGKLFGTQDVVPPPPSVSAGSARNAASEPTAKVVAPPPSMGAASNPAGSSISARSHSPSLAASNVIPPPPSVAPSSAAHNSSESARNSGAGNPGPLATNVIPPPPTVGADAALSASGRRGSGPGAAGEVGSVLAPPKGTGGNPDNSGIVVSSQPGSKVGMPSGGKASLAMSPSGGDKPGLGGSGGGSSIGHGDASGSGLKEEKPGEKPGDNPGAGKAGIGHGSEVGARAGISPTPGPGGAGTAPTGSPAVPGVDVRGGSSVITLPSFGSDVGSGGPNLPPRSSVKQQDGPGITIVATSRSGGAFDFYGKLAGDNYTVYVDTSIGTVVMQFAEANPAAHAQPGSMVGPQGLRTDLPSGLPHARVVIKCKLDTSGNLRNLQVLEPGPAAMTAKIMAALPGWKFRPAMRGTQPVEVNAILGFNIDTNDRY